MRDGLPDATFAGYPPNCETARRGANCPLERWIWVWDLRANGVGSAGFYSSRLGNRAHQIFRKCEKAKGSDKNAPDSEEKIAGDREE